MASSGAAHGTTTERDPRVEHTGFRLSWGAIFAGLVVATALQMVLTTLGAAIGFAAYDPAAGDSGKALGVGALIWAALTAIGTLYLGGMTTGRLAGILTRGDGMLHGVILWALSTLLAIHLLSSGAGALLGGTLGALGKATGAVAGGVANAAGSAAGTTIEQQSNDGEKELDFDALQREIETTLGQTGNPALSPDSLQGAADQAQDQAAQSAQGGASNQQVAQELGDLLRSKRGEVGRDEMVNVIAARTGKSRAEAEQIATQVETRVQSARTQVGQQVAEVRDSAVSNADQAGEGIAKAAWGALLVMGLSVAAAAFGAAQTARE